MARIKSRIQQPRKRQGRHISGEAVTVRTDYDSAKAVFSFEHCCDKHYTVRDLVAGEFKALHKQLQLMSRMDWRTIRAHRGLEYSPANESCIRVPKPQSVPDDCSIDYFRVNQKFRVYGYRAQNLFYFIWFDRNHEILP